MKIGVVKKLDQMMGMYLFPIALGLLGVLFGMLAIRWDHLNQIMHASLFYALAILLITIAVVILVTLMFCILVCEHKPEKDRTRK